MSVVECTDNETGFSIYDVFLRHVTEFHQLGKRCGVEIYNTVDQGFSVFRMGTFLKYIFLISFENYTGNARAILPAPATNHAIGSIAK